MGVHGQPWMDSHGYPWMSMDIHGHPWTSISIRRFSSKKTKKLRLPNRAYIYIYTSVNPCITCTKQSGAEQKLMPIKDEQEAALFERPFRTQETNAPHGCGLERHFSSMLRLLGRLERHPSSILRLRGGSSGICRAFCGSGADSSGTRRAFCGSGADSSGTFRVFCGSGAGSSGHFEPAAAPGRARAAISSHLRLRARLERPYAANSGISRGKAGHESPVASERPSAEANFMNRCIYIY